MSLMEQLAQTVIEGDIDGVQSLVQKGLDEGTDADDILQKGLMQGMDEVGRRFSSEEMFIPEVMRSARVMHSALEILRPILQDSETGVRSKGRMVLGTVEGDIHDIGKSLVEMMLTANGFEVIDIGINVSPQSFVEAIKEYKPDLVGMSALLTSTMPAITSTIEAIEKEGLRKKLKIIIGGAPISEEFTEESGADLYGENALEAVEVVEKAQGLK